SFAVVAFAPDGKTVAAAGYETPRVTTPDWPGFVDVVTLWDVHAGRERATLRYQGTNSAVRAPWGLHGLAFAPDGQTLAAAVYARVGNATTGAVSLVDVAGGQERTQFKTPDKVRALAFSPDGKTLALQAGGTYSRSAHQVRLCDTLTGQERAT